MFWGFGEDGNGETGYSDRMEDDGCVVEIAKERDAEAVDEGMRYQKCGIDPDRFASGGCIASSYCCCRGDESRTAECDARRYGDLTEQIEPACDPRVES